MREHLRAITYKASEKTHACAPWQQRVGVQHAWELTRNKALTITINLPGVENTQVLLIKKISEALKTAH